MKLKWMFGLVALVCAQLLFPSHASAEGERAEFYWRDSYGRGVGVIPKLDCVDGKEKDGGLCYNECKKGFKGEGPLCIDKDNKLNIHGRGAGTVMESICEKGQSKDAGLCYDACRDHFVGVGPVCWSKKPRGYVDCGMGVAKSQTACGLVMADQIASVAFLAAGIAAAANPAEGEGVKAALVAKYSAKFSKLAAKIGEDVPKALVAAKKLMGATAKPMGKILAKIPKGARPTSDELRAFALAAIKEIKANQKLELTAEDGVHTVDTLWTEIVSAMGFANTTEKELEASPVSFLRGEAAAAAMLIAAAGLLDPDPAIEITASLFGTVAAYSWTIYGEEGEPDTNGEAAADAAAK
jgi:hypothetical protein